MGRTNVTMPKAPKITLNPTPEHCCYTTLADKNKRKLEFIENVTTNADDVQKKVLGEILSSNAHVEYLQVAKTWLEWSHC